MGGKSRAVQEKVSIVFDTSLAKTRSITTVRIMSEPVVTKISKFNSEVSLKDLSLQGHGC